LRRRRLLPKNIRVALTADVSLLPSGVDSDLSLELIALLERDPEPVAAQLRAWMVEESA